MSHRLQDDIEFEFSQIVKEADLGCILIPLFKENRIDELQLRAAASLIHSIYNGMEKILILQLKNKEIQIPTSAKWHAELLMSAHEKRLISAETYAVLRKYMSFRHFYRHAYGFMLDQELLYPLVRDSKTIPDIAVDAGVGS
ncbi:ribonuclease toxin HepT-like protein [Spirochaeta lutea]|uniref:ribonuclease toxin HepT-like protein n=1 Tax=Spirochaeta lutea TaxID=1480694 RepID=UPI000691BC15|nr:hypothetical protein [Spirochaeta lutea]